MHTPFNSSVSGYHVSGTSAERIINKSRHKTAHKREGKICRDVPLTMAITPHVLAVMNEAKQGERKKWGPLYCLLRVTQDPRHRERGYEGGNNVREEENKRILIDIDERE